MTAVAVIGAGVMGAGIAQVAAAHGCRVRLMDVDAAVVRRAIDGVGRHIGRLVDKGRLGAGERDATLARLEVAGGPADVRGCDLIIEAVSEKLELKLKVLGPVRDAAGADAVFASNTSSLSISRIGRELGIGRRMAGMHFFNPAPLMPLVEVVTGEETDHAVTDRVAGYARGWGKTVVRAKDTPGFIVNRVARGYYLEALRMLAEGVAGVEEIDRTMRELGGFRLGPFELMDLIGIDTNYSVSVSVWEQLGRPARLAPHPVQEDLYRRGQLGRKTGKGFYSYETDPPRVAVAASEGETRLPPEVRDAADSMAGAGARRGGAGSEHYVFSRVLAAVINEAFYALDEGVASGEDIDTAMRLGTNYPKGPLEWAREIGLGRCGKMLAALDRAAGDDRFRPARPLRATGQNSCRQL